MADIPIPVVETLIHPPLGLVKRALITGVFSGEGSLSRPTGALPPFNNVNAYGLTWSIFNIPAGWGRELGSPQYYEPRLVQLSTVHADYEGHQLISEWHDFFSEGVYWLWQNAGPLYVHFVISPGVVLNFWWLVRGPLG